MPEAWPSMRSTARCVLAVLVGPSTAARRAGARPVGRSLMGIIWGRRESRASGAGPPLAAPRRRRVQPEACRQQRLDRLAGRFALRREGHHLAPRLGEFPDLLP